MTTLTANLTTLVGGDAPRRAQLVISAPPVKDTAGAVIYSGGWTVPFDADGKLSTTLLATDTADTDPVSWQYGFQVKWEGGSLPPFYAEVTGDTIDLSDLQPMDEADPVYLPVVIPQSRVTDLEDDLEDISVALVGLADGLEGKQPLAAMLTKLAALAATLTEGQLIGWNDTLDEPVAVNPSGAGRLGGASNVTGTTTAMTAAVGVGSGIGTEVVIPATAFSATNSNGRVAVARFKAAFAQTAVGTCYTQLFLYETTGGVFTKRGTASIAAGASIPITISGEWEIGVITTTRTFELRGRIITTAAAMSGNFSNSVAEPTLAYAVAQ